MTVSIADIMKALGCKRDRAAQIMLMELPHFDIGVSGSRRPTWRAKQSDFDAWQKNRIKAAGNDRLTEFSRKYM